MNPTTTIYKISPRSAWEEATKLGSYRGAPIDVQDGFIHFSAGHQVRETLAKHFSGQSDLLLLAFETSQFGKDLRWEVSRGGDLFPHLYADLPTNAVSKQFSLQLDEKQTHILPEELVCDS